jgi:hypothetical protein
MSALELKAYDIFKTYFKNEDEAQLIIDYIEQTADKKVQEKQLASKTDIKELELKIEQTKGELMKWFIGLFIGLA